MWESLNLAMRQDRRGLPSLLQPPFAWRPLSLSTDREAINRRRAISLTVYGLFIALYIALLLPRENPRGSRDPLQPLLKNDARPGGEKISVRTHPDARPDTGQARVHISMREGLRTMETTGRGEKRPAQKPLRWKAKVGDGHGTVLRLGPG